MIRTSAGWTQADLGAAAGISPNLLNDYERGRKTPTRPRLEQIIAFMGMPPEAVDAVLACIADIRANPRPPSDPNDPFPHSRRRIEAAAAQGAKLAAQFARELLSLYTLEGEALQHRQRADFLWSRLKRRPAEERLALVEDSKRFRGWALCERVAAESIAAAPNHPRQALELAEMALRIADLTPGPEIWRWRLQGYAWAHVGNARRVCNDLPGAEEAMARAWKLWEAGVPGDPGLLEEAWLPWIEAGLRKGQMRFSESLKRIDEALALDRGELRAKILLTKARILETLSDSEGSTRVLRDAAPLIDAAREPYLAFGVRFNLLVALCHLGRAAEAEPWLREVRELAVRLEGELDLVRVVWLEGKIAAGLGHLADAYAGLQQVRREFKARELAYDYALASVDLALLYLEEGRMAEVRTLAAEMLWIFRAQGVHREALAALRLFCDAAQRETVTAELTRRIVLYLYRAQHDPELRFESGQGAEAS
jgi:transcriptional regulator with XRE-family HTH domain